MDNYLYKLIGDIARNHPEMSKILEKYFGENCMKKRGFNIQTLQMTCILCDIDQNRLIQEFEKVQFDRHE